MKFIAELGHILALLAFIAGVFELLFVTRWITALAARKEWRGLSRPQVVWISTIFCVGVLLVAPFIIVAWPHVLHIYLIATQTLGLGFAQLLVSGIVVFAGVAAFNFKLKYQLNYGICEVIFGAVAAIVTARQLKPTADWASVIASLIGCIYIVSRGLNNVKEGTPFKLPVEDPSYGPVFRED